MDSGKTSFEFKGEKIKYQGEIMEVVQDTYFSNGKEFNFEKGRRSPGARLIIETPDSKFLISKEERPGLGLDYRLPGGKVFNSLSEFNEFLKLRKDPKEILEKAREAAINEAKEEAGINPIEMKEYCVSHCGGSFEWDLHYFIVKKYEEVGQNLEEHEKIEPIILSREELEEVIFSGKMKEDRSVAVLLKYLHNKK